MVATVRRRPVAPRRPRVRPAPAVAAGPRRPTGRAGRAGRRDRPSRPR